MPTPVPLRFAPFLPFSPVFSRPDLSLAPVVHTAGPEGQMW